MEEAPAAPGEPASPSDAPGEPDEADPDAQLFGTLWPLGLKVKLDPTVDRARFRRQKERLKGLGYQFRPLGQLWERPVEEQAA